MTLPNTQPVYVHGMPESDVALLSECLAVWRDRMERNALRLTYYDMEATASSLGLTMPKSFTSLGAAVGWPAKAVDMLAARSRFEEYAFTDGQRDAGLDAAMADAGLAQTYREAVTSELLHSCAFLTVSKGGSGDPPVVVMPHSALTAAAVWDYRRRRIKAGAVIIAADDAGNPTEVNLYTDTHVYALWRDGGRWTFEVAVHGQGRPLMEALRHSPSIDRPFGRSRISRAVMSITDNAVRAIIRAEVSSEFYSWPSRYLMGASDSDFERDKLAAYVDSLLIVSKDEDGDVPTYGQLPQMTMQPHMDYMRHLAAMLSGETSIPVSSLGVVHDNPSSAEAIRAAAEDMVIAADALNAVNGVAMRNVGLLALAIIYDTTLAGLSDAQRTLMPVFSPTSTPSIVSQADAMAKLAGVIPGLGMTDVAWEQLGFSDSQRARLHNEIRRNAASDALMGRLGIND
jgi:hypothetical protein